MNTTQIAKVIVTLTVALLVAAVGLAVSYRVHAGVQPLTATEQLNLRNEQVSVTNAENALHSTKEWGTYIDAQNKLQDGIKAVYTTRKLNMDEYTICDGDAAAICAGVPKGTLELRSKKPQAQK